MESISVKDLGKALGDAKLRASTPLYRKKLSAMVRILDEENDQDKILSVDIGTAGWEKMLDNEREAILAQLPDYLAGQEESTQIPAPGEQSPALPGAPTIVSFTADDARAFIHFKAPDDGGSPITAYTATADPGGQTATGQASPLLLNGLKNGTSYTFTVAAATVAGTGPASAPSEACTPVADIETPDAPFITCVVAGNNFAFANIHFDAPDDDGGSPITSYTATSAPGGFIASAETSPIHIVGLENGLTYTFTVKATNAAGTGPESAESDPITLLTRPAAPAIEFVTVGDSEATINFSAPTNDGGSPVTSYTVTSAPGGLTETAPASPIQITGLANGQAYTFTVKATNAAGESPASAPAEPVIPESPRCVANVHNSDEDTCCSSIEELSEVVDSLMTETRGQATEVAQSSGLQVKLLLQELRNNKLLESDLMIQLASDQSALISQNTRLILTEIVKAQQTGQAIFQTMQTITDLTFGYIDEIRSEQREMHEKVNVIANYINAMMQVPQIANTQPVYNCQNMPALPVKSNAGALTNQSNVG